LASRGTWGAMRGEGVGIGESDLNFCVLFHLLSTRKKTGLKRPVERRVEGVLLGGFLWGGVGVASSGVARSSKRWDSPVDATAINTIKGSTDTRKKRSAGTGIGKTTNRGKERGYQKTT